MGVFVALLRGINVSGKNIIKMAALRDALDTSDFHQLKTYLQSGNLVFQSKQTDELEIARTISSHIFISFGYDVKVKVLTKERFEQSFEKNPFLQVPDIELKQLYYIHTFGDIDSTVISEMKEDVHITEQLSEANQIIYVNYNKGYGKSKITHSFFERKLKIPVTARNNNTMKNLVQLANDITD